jgi:hypothetical protein
MQGPGSNNACECCSVDGNGIFDSLLLFFRPLFSHSFPSTTVLPSYLQFMIYLMKSFCVVYFFPALY